MTPTPAGTEPTTPQPQHIRDLYETLQARQPAEGLSARIGRIATALDWPAPEVWRALRRAGLDLAPPPTEVAELYARRIGLGRIAARYAVGQKRIRRTLTDQDIPIRPPHGEALPDLPSEAVLRRLHHDERRTVTDIARQYHRGWHTIAAALAAAGIQRRRYPHQQPITLPAAEAAEIHRRYNEGAGLARLAAEFNHGIATIRRTLTDRGVPIRPPTPQKQLPSAPTTPAARPPHPPPAVAARAAVQRA